MRFLRMTLFGWFTLLLLLRCSFANTDKQSNSTNILKLDGQHCNGTKKVICNYNDAENQTLLFNLTEDDAQTYIDVTISNLNQLIISQMLPMNILRLKDISHLAILNYSASSMDNNCALELENIEQSTIFLDEIKSINIKNCTIQTLSVGNCEQVDIFKNSTVTKINVTATKGINTFRNSRIVNITNLTLMDDAILRIENSSVESIGKISLKGTEKTRTIARNKIGESLIVNSFIGRIEELHVAEEAKLRVENSQIEYAEHISIDDTEANIIGSQIEAGSIEVLNGSTLMLDNVDFISDQTTGVGIQNYPNEGNPIPKEVIFIHPTGSLKMTSMAYKMYVGTNPDAHYERTHILMVFFATASGCSTIFFVFFFIIWVKKRKNKKQEMITSCNESGKKENLYQTSPRQPILSEPGTVEDGENNHQVSIVPGEPNGVIYIRDFEDYQDCNSKTDDRTTPNGGDPCWGAMQSNVKQGDFFATDKSNIGMNHWEQANEEEFYDDLDHNRQENSSQLLKFKTCVDGGTNTRQDFSSDTSKLQRHLDQETEDELYEDLEGQTANVSLTGKAHFVNKFNKYPSDQIGRNTNVPQAEQRNFQSHKSNQPLLNYSKKTNPPFTQSSDQGNQGPWLSSANDREEENMEYLDTLPDATTYPANIRKNSNKSGITQAPFNSQKNQERKISNNENPLQILPKPLVHSDQNSSMLHSSFHPPQQDKGTNNQKPFIYRKSPVIGDAKYSSTSAANPSSSKIVLPPPLTEDSDEQEEYADIENTDKISSEELEIYEDIDNSTIIHPQSHLISKNNAPIHTNQRDGTKMMNLPPGNVEGEVKGTSKPPLMKKPSAVHSIINQLQSSNPQNINHHIQHDLTYPNSEGSSHNVKMKSTAPSRVNNFLKPALTNENISNNKKLLGKKQGEVHIQSSHVKPASFLHHNSQAKNLDNSLLSLPPPPNLYGNKITGMSIKGPNTLEDEEVYGNPEEEDYEEEEFYENPEFM